MRATKITGISSMTFPAASAHVVSDLNTSESHSQRSIPDTGRYVRILMVETACGIVQHIKNGNWKYGKLKCTSSCTAGQSKYIPQEGSGSCKTVHQTCNGNM